MKRLLLICLVALLSLSLGCSGPAPAAATPTPAPTASPTPSPSPTPEPTLLETIQAAGVLKVAISPDYAPYEFLGKDGNPTGSDVTLAEYLAQGLGLTLTLLPTEGLDAAIASIDEGSAHLVISCLADKPERRAAYAVSDPYGGTPIVEEAPAEGEAAEAPADETAETEGETSETAAQEETSGSVVIPADYTPIPMENGLVILGQAGDETLMEAVNELIYVLNRDGLYEGYLREAIIEADALRMFD